ncbi:MAG: terpene cyclase/mutase family protein [Agarilytica sp.]
MLAQTIQHYILSCQQEDGAILWFKGGKLDPWDHCEAAMALSISGNYYAFRHAFEWLIENQNKDGSWFAKYKSDENDDDLDREKIETNFVAYPACALWHYYLISQDKTYLQRAFPTVMKAIDFVIQQQNSEGDIQWANSNAETLPKDALVTACASITRSLECAINIANILEIDHDWEAPYHSLANCLTNKPWRFDRTWEPKTRFSMDWFYPILSGIYQPEEARIRIDERWNEFVHPEFGCRCVSDEPWVTVAESCELCLALIASGRKKEAQTIFKQLLHWQDEDGGFWTGYSFRDEVIWPKEKTTWTAAAVLLVLDALENLTPASKLFTTPSALLFPPRDSES